MKLISKALVLTAHPDDLELSCGGTVRKIIDQGGSVDNLIIYPYQEHKKYLPDTSKILGFKAIFYDANVVIGQRGRSYERPKLDNKMIERIEKQLNITSYDLLITHWKEDWHQDHRTCYDISNSLRRKQPLQVWYMNAFPYCQKYISFEANVFVDISQQVKAKRKAIEVYKNVNPRWADDVESMSKFRGSFINKQHAEVFKADTILF